MHCSGWKNIILMDCVLMQLRRCYTWITHARKASGSEPIRREGKFRCNYISQRHKPPCAPIFPRYIDYRRESTAWPGVTTDLAYGGLGFSLKWNMGWMHDMLKYFSNDPLFRMYHHNKLTFALLYAFSERFLLHFHTMKLYTEKLRFFIKCREMTGRNFQISDCCTDSCMDSPGKNYFSWEASLHSEMSGTMNNLSTGTLLNSLRMLGCKNGFLT